MKQTKTHGKFKRGTPKSLDITEFVTIISKIYAFTCDDEGENYQKIKRITKEALKVIIFNNYKDCLDKNSQRKKKLIKN